MSLENKTSKKTFRDKTNKKLPERRFYIQGKVAR